MAQEIVSTEELFGQEQEVQSSEQLFGTPVSPASETVPKKQGWRNLPGNLAKQIYGMTIGPQIPSIVGAVKRAVQKPETILPSVKPFAEKLSPAIGEATVGMPKSLMGTFGNLLKNPKQTVIDDPMGVIFLVSIAAGAAGGKIRAKSKAGIPITKVEVAEAAKNLPKNIPPQMMDEILANLPDKIPTQKPTAKPMGKPMAGEIALEKMGLATEPPPAKPAGKMVAPTVLSTEELMSALEKKVAPMGGMTIEGQLPSEIRGIRLDKLNAPNDVRNMMAELAAKLPEKGGPRKWATVEHEASSLGLTVEELHKAKGAFTDTQLEAARKMQAAQVVKVVEVQERYRKVPTDENLIQFASEMDRAALIMNEVRLKKTFAGRALNILRKEYLPGEVKYKQMEQVLKKLGGRERTQELLERFSKLDLNNPFSVRKFITDNAKIPLKNKIFEVWINALLFNPATWLVNASSNAVVLFGRPIEKGISAALQAPKRLVGKIPEITFTEAGQEIVGMVHGFREGVRRGAFAWKNEIPMEGLSKLELAHTPAIPGRFGRVIRTPGRILSATDEFFKGIIYESDLYAQAYRRANLDATSGSINRAGVLRQAQKYIENPDLDMINHASRASHYGTFTKELGKMAKHIEAARGGIPGLRYIIPFLRTPMNIAKYGLERTPLNIPRVAAKAIKGELRGATLAGEASKIALGTSTGLAIFMLALEDKITGSGPKDQNARAKLYRTGWQPYSIKIKDTYYQFSRLEPFGTILGLSADAAEIWKDIKEGERDTIASRIVLSVTQNLTNKTFLQGLSNAMNAIADPERYGDDFIKNFVGSPIPSGVAATARAVDPYIRDTQGILDHLKSRIPGISQTLPPKRDIYGKPLERGGTAVSRGISPVRISEVKENPIDMELKRLGLDLGMPSRRVGDKKLPSRAYSQLSQRVGERVYRVLSQVIQSPMYPRLSDEVKKKRIRSIVSQIRGDVRQEWREE